MAKEEAHLTVSGPHGERELRVSSPGRVVWPAMGLTKLDLARYVVDVGDAFMAANGDRPVTLQRFKDTVDGEQFFSKNPPKGAPDFVAAVDVDYPSGRSHPQLVFDEIAAAVWAVQMNTVVFHPWASRADNPDNPDELRIDLDPQPGTGFAEAVPVAKELRRVLAEAGLDAFIKTSGNRGLHVLCPDRADPGVPGRAARRHRGSARTRAPPARAGHHRVVEGGTRRPHLRRLQPGEPRPHDSGGLQPARPRQCDRVVPDPLGGAGGVDPAAFTILPCRSGSKPPAIRGRACMRAPGTVDSLLEWWEQGPRGRAGGAAVPAGLPQDAGGTAAGAAEPGPHQGMSVAAVRVVFAHDQGERERRQ